MSTRLGELLVRRGLITTANLARAAEEAAALRDVEGLSSEEVRSDLEISETNQRVLLHRARSKVRAALEDYYADA